MKTFILVGERAIANFQEENWSDFQATLNLYRWGQTLMEAKTDH